MLWADFLTAMIDSLDRAFLARAEDTHHKQGLDFAVVLGVRTNQRQQARVPPAPQFLTENSETRWKASLAEQA